jgi:hypothetical protein
MALTQVVRMRLESNGFAAFYEQHVPRWTTMAQQARDLMQSQLPAGQQPTVDDIRKTLLPLVEIAPQLRTFLAIRKLRQKYWVGDFTDYILHRIYRPALQTPAEN